MDWLILLLGVPAILIPLVLLFGFVGCGMPATRCADDSDCARGDQCIDGQCFFLDRPDPPPPPSAPVDLHATARDDHSVSLRWTNTEPAATDFQIDRAAEDGDFEPVIPAPTDLSGNGGTDTDASGLQEGVTYIYRVRAVVEREASDPSEESLATVLPKAPVNLVATPAGINQIVVSWGNASAVATEFSLEHRVPPGGNFREIFRGPATTFTDARPVEGTHEYQVFAIVDGVQDDVPQDGGVKSAATAITVTFAFTAAFTAPPGTLTTDDTGAEGICVVQRLSQTLLTASGTQVRISLRGSTVGSLTLDRITISQPAATGDPYDSASDLTDVASGVIIPPNTVVTVGPVDYTLDRTKDLLVAFDISNTPGEGNTRFGALTGGDTFVRAATAEAGVQDRTTGYPAITANNVALIEKIEVL